MDFSERHKEWPTILEDLKKQPPLKQLVILEKALLIDESDLDNPDQLVVDSYKIESSVVKELVNYAREAREESYAPYSHFNVGCAVLAENMKGERKIFKGCNVENASYGLTICSERTAIPKAVTEGYRRVHAYAVVGGFDYSMPEELRRMADEDFIMPCGACRQVTYEFEADPCLIIMAKDKGEVLITEIDNVLPIGFGPKSLGADVNQYSRKNVKSN